MPETKTIAELQRDLREMRIELNAERAERTRAEAIRAEVAKRAPRDAAAVEAIIAGRTRVNGNGDTVGLDAEGRFDFGTAPGAYKSVADMLDEMQRSSPEMFGGTMSASTSNAAASAPKNPWMKGPNYSVTEQMLLLRSDPKRAEFLEYQAAVSKDVK